MGSDRNFGLVLGAAFVVVALLPLVHGGAMRPWAFIPAALLAIPAIVYPKILAPLNKLWFQLGLLLGRVVAPIMMFLMYIIVFTPFALVMRLFGKDPLRRKYDPSARTYWIERGEGPGKTPPMGSMKNQF